MPFTTESTTNRVLTLSLLIETLRREQAGPLCCPENKQAIEYLSAAKALLISGTTRRLAESRPEAPNAAAPDGF